MPSPYKSTLNMPKTTFKMRGNLAQKDPLFRKRWLQQKIYQQALNKNVHNEKYVVHDGPPYANGDIHLGTAMNKILKDIVVRFKTMQGFYSPFVSGWDTHGLPIENKMLKESHQSHNDLSVLELRKKASEYARSQVKNQKKQFASLQLLSDLKEDYLTLNHSYEAGQLRLFQKMIQKKLVFQAFKPVYWSPTSQTALAEAEVEYKSHVSPSIFVAFQLLKNDYFFENTKIIIWTTTPWTLLANAAVAISEDINYVLVKVKDQHFICAENQLETLTSKANWENVQIIKHPKHAELINCQYYSFFTQKNCPIIFGHHVTAETGSGLVHIAPLFGEDDFIIGKKLNLPMIMHVNDKGFIINSSFDNINNLFYLKANSVIIETLKLNGNLIIAETLKHRFPYDWRTNKPIMYRGTLQWFVSINKIKDDLLDNLQIIKFTPGWAKDKLTQMTIGRDDWCISRQRSWGVPLIVFYDQNNKPVFDDAIFDHVISLVEKHGTDIWYSYSNDELLPSKYHQQKLRKEVDIMDVWFDSGSSNVVKLPFGLQAPYDLYLEGSDQYRGWFNSSHIISIIFRNKPAFKNLLSHGFVVDGKGQKMSKSVGNVINPNEIISKQGSDILRLWVANADFTKDVTISQQILKQTSEYYRRIRNTFRFMLGNLYDFDESTCNVKLDGVHLLIEEKIKKLHNEILKAYEQFNFQHVIKSINTFFVELSGFYFEIAKDALYADYFDSPKRRQYQKNINFILQICLKALAPIMPTTCEEIYDCYQSSNKSESIHLTNFDSSFVIDTNFESDWSEFMQLREEIYREIEIWKQTKKIHRNNELKVIIKTKSTFLQKLNFKELFMVGDYEFGEKTHLSTFDSAKCERCWNHVLEAEISNNICQRCKQVLQKIKD